ncbi:hypothetical protein EVAR_53599_1 [Eumeta japonica]|uniref:Uncharacterized protein n=1 Tax=Eumeta variegata TaxID=151549 RepID=A0A4C1WYI5_EUMVA|nr:hypothetical protein EVAR_53599_1 [Eumeta japonica]
MPDRISIRKADRYINFWWDDEKTATRRRTDLSPKFRRKSRVSNYLPNRGGGGRGRGCLLLPKKILCANFWTKIGINDETRFVPDSIKFENNIKIGIEFETGLRLELMTRPGLYQKALSLKTISKSGLNSKQD